MSSSEVTFEILEQVSEEDAGVDINFVVETLDLFEPDPFEFEPTWEPKDNEIAEELIEEICKA